MPENRALVLRSRVACTQFATSIARYGRSVRRKGNSLLLLVFLPIIAVTSAPAQGPASQAQPATSGIITEAALKPLLVGKFLYLRGRYFDDSLSFNERGQLLGNSPQGSYTLCVIRIDSLHLTRHKLELQGHRYGLHFLGALSSEASANAVDQVRITPRKKWVRISIARMNVVKQPKKRKGTTVAPILPTPPDATTTTSPAFAATVLRQAIGNVFASSLDARMLAAMPAFWRQYYGDPAAQASTRQTQATVLRVSEVDRKPGLIGHLDAPSNQYAQTCGIVGVALYSAVIGADGAPQEIAIARPIGFGLDENAVAAIQSARFSPALKDGKPVPVLLDLVVEFRIYSRRTSNPATSAGAPSSTALPGPYSAGQQ
jgi:outer membrane biosynthesis protein TonB